MLLSSLRRILTHRPYRLLSAFAALGLALALTACFESTDDNYTIDNSVKYVAMGNSLTAGFQDGGLVTTKQTSSYPALLANAMGIADFSQPLLAEPGIGSQLDANKHPAGPLVLNPLTGELLPAKIDGDPAALDIYAKRPTPFNNLGVPGATTKDVFNAIGSVNSQSKGNAYFDLIIRGTSLMANKSMLAQAIAQQPEIITLEIGNNDILGGILNGTINIDTTGGKPITVTPPAVYESYMKKIVDSLMHSTSAKIFIGNIPEISSIPFVATIPNFIVDSTFTPVTIGGSTIPWATEEDSVQYVLFPALPSLLAKKIGLPSSAYPNSVPIPATLTLTKKEVAIANSFVTGYNLVIDSIVNANKERIVKVDVNALLKNLTSGKISGLNADHPLIFAMKQKLKIPVTGVPAFSLDGIHPNNAGYKQIAQIFLDAINTKMGQNYKL